MHKQDKKISISVFSDKPLGTILISGEKLSFSQNIDPGLKNFVDTLVQEGVPYMQETKLPDRFISVFKKTIPGDDNFYFELTKALKGRSYEIAEEHGKVDLEIKILLSFLPDTPAEQEIKSKINMSLAQMNFLEKTYIKQIIEEKLEEAVKTANLSQ